MPKHVARPSGNRVGFFLEGLGVGDLLSTTHFFRLPLPANRPEDGSGRSGKPTGPRLLSPLGLYISTGLADNAPVNGRGSGGVSVIPEPPGLALPLPLA